MSEERTPEELQREIDERQERIEALEQEQFDLEMRQSQWRREHPVYTCIDITRQGMSLDMFDKVLKDIYAPALREQLQSYGHFHDIVFSKRRLSKRVWYKPWTWKRHWIEPLKTVGSFKTKEEYARSSDQADATMMAFAGMRVVTDPLCPPDRAYLLDRNMLVGKPDGEWQGYTPSFVIEDEAHEWFDNSHEHHHDADGNHLGGG